MNSHDVDTQPSHARAERRGVSSNDSLTVTHYRMHLGEGMVQVLTELGVSAGEARRWGVISGIQEATLYVAVFNADTDPEASASVKTPRENDAGEKSVGASRRVFLWEVHRPLTSQRRIAGWVSSPSVDDNEAISALTYLVQLVIDEAQERGALLVKAETHADDVLALVLSDLSFQELIRRDGAVSPEAPQEFHFEDMCGWVLQLSGEWLSDADTPAYERQKTDFTCGPTAGLMALNAYGFHQQLGCAAEVDMWREATYFGGSGHYGLALSIARRGLTVEVLADTAGPVLGIAGPHALIPYPQRYALYEEHRTRALEAGVSERIGDFSTRDIDKALDEKRMVILLVDLHKLNGETVPHWILVWRRVADTYLVHDPWSDEAYGESWVETHSMAISADALWDIAQWEEISGEAHRAALILG